MTTTPTSTLKRTGLHTAFAMEADVYGAITPCHAHGGAHGRVVRDEAYVGRV